MDLDQEETIATDDDSGEVNESIYLRRLMLTGHQSSSSNVVFSAELSEDISPQIELQCCTGQSRKTSTAEQTHGTMHSQANTLRDQAVLTQEQNSPGRDHILHSEVVRPNPIQDTVSLDAPQRQPGPVLRHSTRKIVRTDLLDKMKSPPQQNTQRRSLPSKKKNPDTKALSTALPTRAKQTKPNFSQGIINRKTGKALLRNSINRRNKFGETKLHLAVMQEDLQDVRDMISVGASINVADYAGWTPLHEAVNRNNYDITEVLLKAGAQANCKGDDGVTPLLEAIQYQYYKIVDLLLKYGADPLLKCDRGKTPMDMITDRSMYMVVEKYLQKTKSDTFTADNSPRTTDSGVNPSVDQSRNQNPIRDTRPPLQKSKRTADESEHEGSVQCSAAEPVPGPSREQPNLEPSAQTSTNELFVRNQEQDFCSQGSLLLQDQESEGSDTSSCPDSELTMDYIEDRSSSPQHWTLYATQDFSATNIG